jgi:hypothetical protein
VPPVKTQPTGHPHNSHIPLRSPPDSVNLETKYRLYI